MSVLTAFSSAVPATTYDGYFYRGSLAAQGFVPANPPYSQCPDIIASAVPLPDAQSEFSSVTSWNTSYDCDPIIGAKTYYYLRTMNGALGAGEDNNLLSLHWAPAELILFPSLWKNNPMRTSKGSEVVKTSASSGHIGVGDQAFVWAAPQLPYRSSFYSFVATAQAANTPCITADTGWIAMGQLMTQQLSYGFRNIAYVDPGARSWLERVGLTIPPSVETKQTLQVSLTARGFGGCTAALLFDRYSESQKLIGLAPTELNETSVTGFSFIAKPGLAGSLAIQIWNPGMPLKAGSSLSLTISMEVPPSMLDDAVSGGALDSRIAAKLALPGQGGNLKVGPKQLIPLGQVTIVTGNPVSPVAEE